jgi:hypothetical protein
MNRASSRWLTTVLVVLLATPPLSAQSTPAPAPAPAPSPFSGLIFGNYNYLVPTTPAQLPGQIDNAFVLDRAYLTFRMPAGDHASIRITTDVYLTTENTPNAYTVRAKYAYLQYDVPKYSNGASLFGRLGILQNVVIDNIETFWPRYISQTPVERAGYFASADMGIAAQYNLPNKLGEVYTTIVNGPGYTTRENNRFKDYAMRLSLTPLANQVDIPLLQTFTLTAWGYKGALASSFVSSGVGQALNRSRAGVFVGIKDPRLQIGGEFDQRWDNGEQGTSVATRIVTETTGRLLSGYTVARPMAFINASGASRFGFLARYDKVTPAASTSGFVSPPPPLTNNEYHVFIGGLFYDLNQKAQFALDYQEALDAANSVGIVPPTQSKTYYVHFLINF